jgi:calcium-dependent protein kinase
MPSFTLKWNKEEFDLDINVNATVALFKAQVRALTSVPVDRQKYLGIPGGMLKDSDDLIPRLAKLKPGAKITLMGTAEASQLREPAVKTIFEEDMPPLLEDVRMPLSENEEKATGSCKLKVPLPGRRIKRDLAADFIMELNQYNVRWLGSGTTGPVRQAIRKETGAKYAVKRLLKKDLTLEQQKDLQREVDVHLALDHPQIVRLDWVYETDDVIDLVMEVMEGGHLYDRLNTVRWYAEEEAANAAHQMLVSVAYLHSRNIVHRDLKAENFLYESKGGQTLKLIDFGLSKFWDQNVSGKMSRFCGTLAYMSPQVLNHSYTEKADMWSLGCLVYLLLFGSLPFGPVDDSIQVDEKRIRSGSLQWPSRFTELTSLAQEFLKTLLVVDPSQRLSAAKALGHLWITSNRTESPRISIDTTMLQSLRRFTRHSSHFRRVVLSAMAWSLSFEDCFHLRDQFMAIASEKRGTIALKELEQALGLSSSDNESDVEGEGEISYSEFLASALQDPLRLHQDLFQSTFRRFDVQHLGKITQQSLREVICSDSYEGCSVEEMIREVDRKGDGCISYEEFVEYFQHCGDLQAETPKSCRADAQSGQTPPLHRTKKLCMR